VISLAKGAVFTMKLEPEQLRAEFMAEAEAPIGRRHK
jgi:hypothetical protein